MTRRDSIATCGGAAIATAVAFLVGGWPVGTAGKPTPKVAAEPPIAEAPTSTPIAHQEDDAWRTANANLAQQVKFYQDRMERNVKEKTAIERELKIAKEKLHASEHDGALPRSEFDLTQDDWKLLAETGTVKARYPCGFQRNWTLQEETAEEMGLSPSDAPVVEAAVKRSEELMWQSVLPGCAAVLESEELAVRLGTQVCLDIVREAAKSSAFDIRLVANIRAGNIPLPPDDQLDGFAKVLLAETGAMQAITDDLAQTFGRDEANHIAFSDQLGSCSGRLGGTP